DDAGRRWIMGAVAALVFFASIVLHEFGHAIVARRKGIPIDGITLFIFGGIAEMTEEPPDAGSEFWMAIGGPLVSVLLGAAFLAGAWIGRDAGAPVAVTGVLQWLGFINLALVVFNMVPAFPLDGGRVLRSIVWYWQDDLRSATQFCAGIGSGFGFLLIALAIVFLFNGQIIGAVWWFMLGMFLRGAAQMSVQRLEIRRALEGQKLDRFVETDPVTVTGDLSLEQFVDDFVYEHHYKMYPVVSNTGELEGMITTRQVKEVDRSNWADTRVRDIARPASDDNSVEMDADPMDVLGKMNDQDHSRLLVTRDGELAGIISLKDMLRFISTRIDLEGDGNVTGLSDVGD
ncbi:MAG: site-2 protease family protein, partial [Phycisphaeraceae bacterium]|nr:site-2 protease family protein [Phycisphaeraceae bacterium]